MMEAKPKEWDREGRDSASRASVPSRWARAVEAAQAPVKVPTRSVMSKRMHTN